ncbi:hypothetical protein [Neorhodopirellula pilleata]|uniref:hypothetical protein n=1 Tax=Neorhodopirellula pilleata TaxID=2714738 RepID=UPI0011B4A9B7|nr:hypothetical protein [Neorhodopirellula pilleata]
MRLNWIASTTLSLLRAVESAGRSSARTPLKQPEHVATIRDQARRVTDRLVSASVIESDFWDHLIDEVVSCGNDPALTAQLCEVALLRAGHSHLQSDQTAAAIFRSLETCRLAFQADSPRLAEQLRLRYAPLKQAYEAYGPGMLRSIGNQIWNGSPPKDWWPGKATVHAAAPIMTGAAGRSTGQTSVWIEAVLTDVSPEVPEWLRLVHQLTEMAVETHTRTHASHLGEDPAKSSSSSASELPWSLGIVPLILHQAADRGFINGSPMPLGTALRLWQTSDECSTKPRGHVNELGAVLDKWWVGVGSQAKAFPIALKQLSEMLVTAGLPSTLPSFMEDR